MREISAGIIAYRTTAEGPRFLILYHGHNYWNFPKGKIESEEKSFQTAVREVREETGLTRNDLRFNESFKTSENFTFWRNKEKIYKTIVFYLAETTQQRIKLPEQTEAEGEKHEGYGWFTYKEALKVLTKEDSQRVLKQAYNFLRNVELRKQGALRLRRQPQGDRPRRIEGQERPPVGPGQRSRPSTGGVAQGPQIRRDAQEQRRRPESTGEQRPATVQRPGSAPQRRFAPQQPQERFPRRSDQNRTQQRGYRQRPERTEGQQPQRQQNGA